VTEIQNAHELANSMLGAVVAHVRAVAGEGGVEQVLREAGERRTAADIAEPNGWSSYRQGLALFTVAARVLDDPDVGRKAGMELLRRYAGSEVLAMLRSFGSPTEMLRMYPAIQAKQSTVTRSEVLEVGTDRCVISVTTVEPIVRDRLFCGYTCGVLSQMPVLFGMAPATVVETECQTRGSPRCVFEVDWDPTSSFQSSLEEEVAFLRGQVAVFTERFESLEAIAKELSSAREVDTVLATITRHAAVAVRAPRYLLVVRLAGDVVPRIHSIGFTEQEAAEMAELVLGQPAESVNGSHLIVDIASARTHFGRLAAFYPRGYQFLPQERSLLLAYAGHAAAALETVAALDESRDRNATLSALLTLGNALSQVSSRQEVAESVVGATLGVASCSRAHVLLWDADDAVLTRAATAPLPGEEAPLPSALREGGLADRMIRYDEPTEVSLDSDPELRGVLALIGLDHALIAALTARSQLLGLLAIDVPSGAVGRTAVVRGRLTGVASLASTALDGVNLLDEVRHQAFHDSITDLPNIRLFEDRVSQAIVSGRRGGGRHGFLFIDLDHFKPVNDTHGHKVGDDLLRAVARRLSTSVRDADTVGRLGGDEFGILVQNVETEEDLALIGQKVVTAIADPFSVQGLTLAIGASVGITVFPEENDTYDTVLSRADVAMYEAKANGRSRYHFFGEANRFRSVEDLHRL
jgi:diguanylate cyclase (GGDEF)-like protein